MAQSEVEQTRASATILKLAPIYFRFQGRQGHFNVPESVKNNKKLTLKPSLGCIGWLSLIKSLAGQVCVLLEQFRAQLSLPVSVRHLLAETDG